MLRGGFSSVSFRNKACDEILCAAKKAHLSGIEWTADTHLPHGNMEAADELMMATLRKGMTISAYGSWWRLSDSKKCSCSFATVLETCRRLHAPSLRIWAPASIPSYEDLICHARDISDQSGALGITLCLEAHPRSAISSNGSLAELIQKVDHPFFKACWTPMPTDNHEKECAELEQLLPNISLVHVHNWTENYTRKSLSANRECLAGALQKIYTQLSQSGLDQWACIEYLQEETEEVLEQEASILIELLDESAKSKAPAV